MTSVAALAITANLPRNVVARAHHAAAAVPLRRRASATFGQVPEDVLDHDDGGIDDQAEIDGADRQQIGRFAAHHHQADRERQRERDGGGDDQRAAQVAEEHPLQKKISTMPSSMLCSTVCVVTWIRSQRS